MQEVDQLVKMANQIAENFGFHDDASDRLLEHLQRFWAPSMLHKLADFNAAGGEGLKPDVRTALENLGRS